MTTKTHDELDQIAENLIRNEVLACQSSLVDALIRADFDGFSVDDWENMYPNPSDWTLVECREWLRDQGHDEPTDGNVWKMDRADLVEQLENVSIECRDDETDEVLREAVIANIDDETIGGIDDWRDAVRDNAEAAEVYEWWLVTNWLRDKLRAEGEVIIDNGYGCWWGRCCTGQAIHMDGIMQRIAATLG